MMWEKEFDERIEEKKFGGRRNDRKEWDGKVGERKKIKPNEKKRVR